MFVVRDHNLGDLFKAAQIPGDRFQGTAAFAGLDNAPTDSQEEDGPAFAALGLPDPAGHALVHAGDQNLCSASHLLRELGFTHVTGYLAQ